MAQQNEHWRRIRGNRARPPGYAAVDEDRKAVFQSALAQAEELWDAAAVAGARSRALPLFYCVSQGGRAICAAWTDAEDWQPKGHGLNGANPPAGTTGGAFVSGYGARIDPRPLGAFGMVAEATASPIFTGTATVAQVWTSMPMFPTPSSLVGALPRCLFMEAASYSESGQDLMSSALAPTHAILGKPPAAIRSSWRRTPRLVASRSLANARP